MGWQLVPDTYVAYRLKCIDGQTLHDERTGEVFDVRQDRTLVYLFQRQIRDRIFLPSLILLKRKNRFLFPVVNLLISYVELIAQLKSGTRTAARDSREVFSQSFMELVPDCGQEDSLFIYDELRSGFAHDAMARRGILVSYDGNRATPVLIPNQNDKIVINPKSLYRAFELDFRSYCDQLFRQAQEDREAQELTNFRELYPLMLSVAPADRGPWVAYRRARR
jgi:hypothetical protein